MEVALYQEALAAFIDSRKAMYTYSLIIAAMCISYIAILQVYKFSSIAKEGLIVERFRTTGERYFTELAWFSMMVAAILAFVIIFIVTLDSRFLSIYYSEVSYLAYKSHDAEDFVEAYLQYK